jgi:hypothetical protein
LAIDPPPDPSPDRSRKYALSCGIEAVSSPGRSKVSVTGTADESFGAQPKRPARDQ